jgi:hypothetical protein
MSSKRTSRTARRLIKLASLGLAGLLAGLLAGCFDAPKTVSSTVPYMETTDQPASGSALPPSLDATAVPALRHAPSARRLQYGSVHVSHRQAHSPETQS